MKYILKSNIENFDVVDGPFAGRRYRRGKIYADNDIPETERHKFESLPERSTKSGTAKPGTGEPADSKTGSKTKKK